MDGARRNGGGIWREAGTGMNARTDAAAARKSFATAMDKLEAALARRPTGAAGDPDAPLAGRVAELGAELNRAERERDAARAALGALRAARAEDARLVEDALHDLREVV